MIGAPHTVCQTSDHWEGEYFSEPVITINCWATNTCPFTQETRSSHWPNTYLSHVCLSAAGSVLCTNGVLLALLWGGSVTIGAPHTLCQTSDHYESEYFSEPVITINCWATNTSHSPRRLEVVIGLLLIYPMFACLQQAVCCAPMVCSWPCYGEEVSRLVRHTLYARQVTITKVNISVNRLSPATAGRQPLPH